MVDKKISSACECGAEEGHFHKEGCAKIQRYKAVEKKFDAVEFLRKQSLYRHGQEGEERDWKNNMNAAADEIERLRSALRQAEVYWSDYHVPCVYEEYDNDCDLCPIIAAVRLALQPLT